jgi:hypothetical protein
MKLTELKQLIHTIIKEELSENKVDYYEDKYGNQFQTVDVNYLQNPGLVMVKYDNIDEAVEYKGNFEADLKSGMIKRLNSGISEAFFIGEDEIDKNNEQEEADVDVECGKCGWKWNTKDSEEDDKYICHRNGCGFDNSYRYANKANNEVIEEYDVENADDIKEFVEFMREYQQQLNEADCDCLLEAEYQGRTVPLGKPMRGDSKKFKVYVKNPKTGKVVKVNFGAKGMNIKKNNPVRRKAFRARHNCANPGPRTKARYWSCRKW